VPSALISRFPNHGIDKRAYQHEHEDHPVRFEGHIIPPGVDEAENTTGRLSSPSLDEIDGPTPPKATDVEVLSWRATVFQLADRIDPETRFGDSLRLSGPTVHSVAETLINATRCHCPFNMGVTFLPVAGVDCYLPRLTQLLRPYVSLTMCVVILTLRHFYLP